MRWSLFKQTPSGINRIDRGAAIDAGGVGIFYSDEKSRFNDNPLDVMH